MHKIILFIKSYRPDFERTLNLLTSIEKFNADKIPVYLSVNDKDFDFFKNNLPNHEIVLIKDSEIISCDLTDGWRYQQVVKSSVYRLGVCKNYLCIDADSEFIKQFQINDFIYEDDTPYTIMHESKPFLEMLEIINVKNIFFKESLDAVRKEFNTHGKYWDYGPSPYLWSCKVWEHFNEVYLKNKGIAFQQFLNELDKNSPSECAIYGEYLRKTKLIDIIAVENFFKVYHFKKQFKLERKYFIKNQLAKIYLGVIVQSNFSDKKSKWLSLFSFLMKKRK